MGDTHFRAEAESLRDELVTRRRDLHMHPELGFEEQRTAGIAAEELSKLGLKVQTGVARTGVVGILECAADGPTVLLRADMDALPIQEENDLPYRSTAAGKMHACGHAAMPYTTIDPVACAGQLINALHRIVGRKMDAMAGAVVLSVTSVRTSSEAYNIIPQQVEIRGTFRTFNAFTSEMLEQHIRSVCQAVCASVGCDVDIFVKHLTIPTVNDPDVAKRMRKAISSVIPEACQDDSYRTMASEDVSYLMDDIPGMYFLVGAGNKAKGISHGHHHPRFQIDEDVLPLGVALFASAVGDDVLRG